MPAGELVTVPLAPELEVAATVSVCKTTHLSETSPLLAYVT
jgi:hypothetical protein